MMPPTEISFSDLSWNLPLFDDLFLSMQGQNVLLVDFYLRDIEHDMVQEYVDTESTPIQAIFFVSALSQMWIFALYELLRTWRQRVRDLKLEGQKHPAEPSSGLKAHLAFVYRDRQLGRLRNDAAFIVELDAAYARIEPLFRRIEALRMNLAKHEIPKLKGVPALAPGYGRIDLLSSSIQWQVDLGDNEVDLVSRRDLADQLRATVIGRSSAREETAVAKKKMKAKRRGAEKKLEKKMKRRLERKERKKRNKRNKRG